MRMFSTTEQEQEDSLLLQLPYEIIQAILSLLDKAALKRVIQTSQRARVVSQVALYHSIMVREDNAHTIASIVRQDPRAASLVNSLSICSLESDTFLVTSATPRGYWRDLFDEDIGRQCGGKVSSRGLMRRTRARSENTNTCILLKFLMDTLPKLRKLIIDIYADGCPTFDLPRSDHLMSHPDQPHWPLIDTIEITQHTSYRPMALPSCDIIHTLMLTTGAARYTIRDVESMNLHLESTNVIYGRVRELILERCDVSRRNMRALVERSRKLRRFVYIRSYSHRHHTLTGHAKPGEILADLRCHHASTLEDITIDTGFGDVSSSTLQLQQCSLWDFPHLTSAAVCRREFFPSPWDLTDGGHISSHDAFLQMYPQYRPQGSNSFVDVPPEDFRCVDIYPLIPASLTSLTITNADSTLRHALPDLLHHHQGLRSITLQNAQLSGGGFDEMKTVWPHLQTQDLRVTCLSKGREYVIERL